MQAKQRFCARCKVEIPKSRVAGLPTTRVCIDCSRVIGSEFIVTFQREVLSKTQSLKKNYGGITVRLERRIITPLKRTVADANPALFAGNMVVA